ncbi:MAG TPA: DUF2059 domain-containing protein [Candidatus Acidoferrum sp.]|nr:DUF2059 domain-containing protein [Candidatus Acidoferrum sp.]
MKIAASFVFLLLAPATFGQNAAVSPPAPAKTQEQATKPAAKIAPEKEAAIRKLFEVAGTKANVEKVIAGMTENMKPMISKMLPPGDYQEKLIPLFFERFQSKLKTEDLLDITVPIYDKYFSKEDIDALAQFYQTNLGKKVLSVLPQVLIESQTAGMKMGEEAGRQSIMEVLAEHPDLQKALQEAATQKN